MAYKYFFSLFPDHLFTLLHIGSLNRRTHFSSTRGPLTFPPPPPPRPGLHTHDASDTAAPTRASWLLHTRPSPVSPAVFHCAGHLDPLCHVTCFLGTLVQLSVPCTAPHFVPLISLQICEVSIVSVCPLLNPQHEVFLSDCCLKICYTHV